MDIEAIDQILEIHEFKLSNIIGILQDAQTLENYLPEEALRYISKKMEISLTRIFDIVTFYKAFSLVPRGKYTVRVCCGTACHLGGAVSNIGQTTDDRMFSLERVNCLGTCALAPVIAIGKDYHDAVDPGKIEKVLSRYNTGSEE
jgi:NADH-quinone oxidoreductase subunit E